MPEQKPSWIPGALFAAPLVLSTPAFGQDAVPVSELTDQELLNDRVMVRGEVRGVPGLFVDVPDLEPVAKHDQNFVYFDAIAEDGKTPICFGVDHLLPVSDGEWRLDLDSARISTSGTDCISMLDSASQDYDEISRSTELFLPPDSDPSWLKQSQLSVLVGPYIEEYDMYTPGVNPDFRFFAGLPVGHTPWMIGGTSNVYAPVAEMERSGLGRVGGVVGRNFDLPHTDMDLLLSVQGGWSRDYNPLLNAPYAGVGGTFYLVDFDKVHSSLVVDILATRDFIGNGWFLMGDLGLSYTGSVGLVVRPGMFISEREKREEKPQNLVIAVEPEPEINSEEMNVEVVDRSSGYNRKVYKDLPEFNYISKLSFDDNDNPDVAEVIRLEEAIQDHLKASQYKGAYSKSLELLELAYKKKIELRVKTYELIYSSGLTVGDFLLTYEATKKLVELNSEDSDNWIQDIESNMGWVSLTGENLEYAMPFDPQRRQLLENIASDLSATGQYLGLMPVLDYSLDGHDFSPSPINEADQVTVVRP